MNDYTQEYTEVLSKTTGIEEENYYYSEHRISNDDTIYTYDGLDNVNMTLSTTGSILKKYEYSDYGERNLDSKTEILDNEYGYNGEAHTVDGLQYLRSRYYDPVTGVFISADSYRGEFSNPLSQNRYTYCHNNPYKYDDPSGYSGIRSQTTIGVFDPDGGGTYTPPQTQTQPLKTLAPVNTNNHDYNAVHIDEVNHGNQVKLPSNSLTLLGNTQPNKTEASGTSEEVEVTGEIESTETGTVTTIVTEPHDNTQPYGAETYEIENTETKVIGAKDMAQMILSGIIMTGIGMVLAGFFAIAGVGATAASIGAAAITGFTGSYVNAKVGAGIRNQSLEEYAKSQGYDSMEEYGDKLCIDGMIGATVGVILSVALVLGPKLISNSISDDVAAQITSQSDNTSEVVKQSADDIAGQVSDDVIVIDKTDEVVEVVEQSAKNAQQGVTTGESGSVSDNYVYRALNQKDYERYSNGLGLEAKNPNGTWSLENHLVNGSSKSSWKNDPYISTTSDLSVAKSFNEFGDGYGIIKIDMNKVSSISYKGYEIFPRVNGEAGLAYHYSVWQQEISVYQTIPFDAIVDYFK
ncbi:MAG: RHS repeat-associated core domain-containing protein [Erysipelotrichaceae bacterium]|nr:RHS repeat-associated core domain-containing protein [Erysipelotrichaceae bacterium]